MIIDAINVSIIHSRMITFLYANFAPSISSPIKFVSLVFGSLCFGASWIRDSVTKAGIKKNDEMRIVYSVPTEPIRIHPMLGPMIRATWKFIALKATAFAMVGLSTIRGTIV